MITPRIMRAELHNPLRNQNNFSDFTNKCIMTHSVKYYSFWIGYCLQTAAELFD